MSKDLDAVSNIRLDLRSFGDRSDRTKRPGTCWATLGVDRIDFPKKVGPRCAIRSRFVFVCDEREVGLGFWNHIVSSFCGRSEDSVIAN